MHFALVRVHSRCCCDHRWSKLQLWDDHRNKRHGENIRVCTGIFTTALRKQKYSQILNRKYLTFLPQCITCRLTACWHEAILETYPFLEFLLLSRLCCDLLSWAVMASRLQAAIDFLSIPKGPLFFVSAHGWTYLLLDNSLSTLRQMTVK